MLRVLAIPWQVRIHLLLFMASLLWILVPAINKTPAPQVAMASMRAASEFLYLVDTEEYAKSWDLTSKHLKDMLSQSAWNEKIAQIRSFLGPIVERVEHEMTYTDSASDVPSGAYVILTFVSRFESREKVIEKLTLMLADNGEWQVAGYFLR